MSEQIAATIVNHAAVNISAPAEAVWQIILEEILEAKGFRAAGNVVPLDDPALPLGGYRITLPGEDGEPDERVVHFTERDDDARRASVRAEYLSVPGGMLVYASYEAEATGSGTRFRLDCHTSLMLDVPSGETAGAAIAKEASVNDEALAANLEKVKQRLETAS